MREKVAFNAENAEEQRSQRHAAEEVQRRVMGVTTGLCGHHIFEIEIRFQLRYAVIEIENRFHNGDRDA